MNAKKLLVLACVLVPPFVFSEEPKSNEAQQDFPLSTSGGIEITEWPDDIYMYKYKQKVLYKGNMYSCYADKSSPYADFKDDMIEGFCRQIGFVPGDLTAGAYVWHKEPDLTDTYRLTYYDKSYGQGYNFFYAIPYLKSKQPDKDGKYSYVLFHMMNRGISYGDKDKNLGEMLEYYTVQFNLWNILDCQPYESPQPCNPQPVILEKNTSLSDISFFWNEFNTPDCRRPLGLCLISPQGKKECITPTRNFDDSCRKDIPASKQPDYTPPPGWNYPNQP